MHFLAAGWYRDYLPVVGSVVRLRLSRPTLVLAVVVFSSARGAGLDRFLGFRDHIAVVVDADLDFGRAIRFGVLVGDVQELVERSRLGSLQLVPEQAVLQKSLGEESDGRVLDDSFTGVAQLGLPGQVVSGRLVRGLHTALQLARATRVLVSGGEVADELPFEVHPAVHAALGQAVQPSSRCALEHEGRVAHRQPQVAACNVDGGRVVDQPIFWLRCAVIL